MASQGEWKVCLVRVKLWSSVEAWLLLDVGVEIVDMLDLLE